MANESPYPGYMNILFSAKKEAREGNYPAAQKLLDQYKEQKKKNDDVFNEEVEGYYEGGRGIMGFIFDKRCLNASCLESLMDEVKEIESIISEQDKD